jgi:thymidylate synthase (FAD)
MFSFKKVLDPWARLRKGLYKNVEPSVELIGHTILTDPDGLRISPDAIPGYTARMSYQSKGTAEDDVRLTKSLLTRTPVAHTGPFENFQWVFKITGISKSCLTQFDRHRIGVGFVQMSGRFMDRNKTGFVYNLYDYITAEEKAANMLSRDSFHYQSCISLYNEIRERGGTKQDARKALPVSMATGTIVNLNTVSIRNFFNLRLDKHAEWEIRRMAKLMLDLCDAIAPAHFFDMKEAIEKAD